MKTWVLVSFIAVLGLGGCSPKEVPPVADLVIRGGAIDTMNPAQPTATALAIRDGKIMWVGDHAGTATLIGGSTQVIDVKGASVWPGLIDSHIHAMEGALSRDACSFEDKQLKLAQVAPIIKECIARTPGDGWVTVQNLNAAGFHATRADLDVIEPKRPLFLFAADGHVGWGNSAAMHRAGVDRKTPDPADGRIERDKKGEATGFLIDNAVQLVSGILEKPTPERRQEVLLATLHDLAASGITTLMEANTSAETVQTYVELARKNQLHTRVTFALGSDGSATDEEFARLKSLRALAEAQPRLRADMIKLFGDGIMEYPTQSAAMLEPYLEAKGKPGKNLGPLYHEPEPLKAFLRKADAQGFNVHIHVIGDRAARVALDGFADARAHGSKRLYSLAHLELVDPADLPRFKELGVIASMQLQWAQPDNYSVDAVLPYIGPERQSRLYPARSLADAGATIAGGSDWNVSTFNPFEAMAVAMSRTNPTQPERGELGPDQKMTLAEMLAAYTINAARMIGREAEVGSLEPGKAADIVVLSRLLDDKSTSQDIRETKVAYTFTDGKMQIEPTSSP